MKLMTSGVTISAAITRSPSFSRSSSSAMTIMRPARNSLSDFSISANFTAWATGRRSSPPDTRETSDETSRSIALGRLLDIGAPIKTNSCNRSHDRERMPHLFLLGPQVRQCVRACRCFAGNQFDDFDSTLCQCFNFLRVVCHQADLPDLKFMQDSHGQTEITAVGVKTQSFVRFDRIETLILQGIGSQFCHEPDATALLILVDHQSRSLVCDGRHCDFQLASAITAQRSKHFAGEALRMNAQQRYSVLQIAKRHHQGSFMISFGQVCSIKA